MPTYDEKHFKAKANRRAGTTWLMLILIVTLYYGVKMSEGALVASQFAVITVVGWLEYFVGALLLKIKGKSFDKYKWVMSIGYLTYFAFISWSAISSSCPLSRS